MNEPPGAGGAGAGGASTSAVDVEVEVEDDDDSSSDYEDVVCSSVVLVFQLFSDTLL